jgi:uncharacterized membrane protein HdeD (DUF308 family)
MEAFMATVSDGRWATTVPDWISLVCGMLLFASPWALGFADDAAAAWTAWASGIVVGVLAIAAVSRFAPWEEWLQMLAGLWIIAAPWVVGFAAVTVAVAAFVVLGIVVALSSVAELWAVRHPTALAR